MSELNKWIEEVVLAFSPNPSFRVCFGAGLDEMKAKIEAYLGCPIEEAKRRLELPQGRVIRKSERPEFGD